MKIIICGASGLLGTALINKLCLAHDLILVSRTPKTLTQSLKQGLKCITWDELNLDLLAQNQCIINLAGENIGQTKWSAEQKKHILNSRIETTAKIAKLCAQLGERSPRLLNASAIGIYGRVNPADQMVFDESSPVDGPRTDFLSEVGQQWEAALGEAKKAGVNVVILRFAVVLASQGGVLQKMLPSFKLGMGAKIGTGKQAFSWVAIDDAISAIQFLLTKEKASGVFNIVADQVVTQHEFAKTLANVLHRPCFFCLPTMIVKLLFGQMGEELLLSGMSVKATRLHELGFQFQYKQLKEALIHIVNAEKQG